MTHTLTPNVERLDQTHIVQLDEGVVVPDNTVRFRLKLITRNNRLPAAYRQYVRQPIVEAVSGP